MPKVSIILPTYNRADTIVRAIKSVQAQTITDWELIIVDDGSSDGTEDLIGDRDNRIRLICQNHCGFAEARNAGIRASSGEYLAFLDSDDEFLPFHLELEGGFLDSFSDEGFVSAELAEDFGNGRIVNHYRAETSAWYPEKARRIHSDNFRLPPGETDNYMRVYESREAIGDWGKHAISQSDGDDAYLYRGRIFKRWTWGYLSALPATLVRRSALERVGLPEVSYNFASDFHFMARLSKHFRSNFLSVPTYIKHELAPEGDLPSEGHVATSSTVLRCKEEMLRAYDDLFWKENPGDREVCALRGIRQLGIAHVALALGQRNTALAYLKAARKSFPNFWEAIAFEAFVRSFRNADLAQRAWNGITKGLYVSRQVRSGELSAKMFLRKALGKLK